MINQIPDSWEYNDSLEMLFLFYQSSDELLSETTPDSFALPLHNTMTLLYEMEGVYELLERYGLVAEYYSKYIPPIIEEFLESCEKDHVLKKMFGRRLQSIRTGFCESINSANHLQSWIALVHQSCTYRKYLSEYKNEIIKLVKETKEKQKLLYCISNYYVSLRGLGYSREYLYTTTKKFFSNNSRIINNVDQISEFLNIFPEKKEAFNFLILLDVYSIEYMNSLSDNFNISQQIKNVDLSSERKNLERDKNASELLKEYDKRRTTNSGQYEKMAIVEFSTDDYDPYSAAKEFCDYIEFIQTFSKYFKHFGYSRQVYQILLKQENGSYRKINLPNKLHKRPYIEQSLIDTRIRNIMVAKNMGPLAFRSITQAIAMHAEAFDSKNTTSLLKTFWTALETLFSNPNPTSTRENIQNSLMPIIQKTYFLKVLRALYAQLIEATNKEDCASLGIKDFNSFLKYYFSYDANSQELKKIYLLLSKNPLLRSRLFETRKKLNCGKNIKNILDNHHQKIEWQIKRIYRLRNIATHLGQPIIATNVAVNHLHNYFDFVVNYLLCKVENGNYIVSISDVVFEAKNDNQIYEEMLKKNETLTGENYLDLLFGPDKKIENYKFEH